MSFRCLQDLVSTPFGTARLLEGACTLRRAQAAGVSLVQLRVMYPELRRCTNSQIEGFTKICDMLIGGEIRIPGKLFNEYRPAGAGSVMAH